MKNVLFIVFIILCVKYTNAQEDIRNIDVGYNNDNKIHYTYEGRKIKLIGEESFWWRYDYKWREGGTTVQTGSTYLIPQKDAKYSFNWYRNNRIRYSYFVTISFQPVLTENIDICKGETRTLTINNANSIGYVRAYEWYEWANNIWVFRGRNSTFTVNIPKDNEDTDGAVRIFRGLAIYDRGSVEKLFNITPRALIATKQIASKH